MKPLASSSGENARGDIIAGDEVVGAWTPRSASRLRLKLHGARIVDLEIGDAVRSLARGARVEAGAENDDLPEAIERAARRACRRDSGS